MLNGKPARPSSPVSVTKAGEHFRLAATTEDIPAEIDRLALQRLLEDIEANKVDTIVVYKVDRLTRSLADFAKIVEALDARGVSFVSVTQQFNTTTSMGRLTLNILLSFAQFEREVTGERIRDKIAASKRKGMWMGGTVPLGYDVKDRKLVVNPDDAKMVVRLFNLYLDLGCVSKLKARLDQEGIKSKERTSAAGNRSGGTSYYRGALDRQPKPSWWRVVFARGKSRITPRYVRNFCTLEQGIYLQGISRISGT
jgi:DNA invertase Pin-like site-specific DNA recombinase